MLAGSMRMAVRYNPSAKDTSPRNLPRNSLGNDLLSQGSLHSRLAWLHQRIAQFPRLAGQVLHDPLVVLLFIGFEPLCHIGCPVLEHAVQQSGQLVSRRRDRFGCPETALHPPKIGTQRTLGMMETGGSQP